MKTITKWIVAVGVANVLLLPLTLAPAKKAVVAQPVATSPLYDCCGGFAGQGPFCCRKCCWRPSTCDDCPATTQR